MKTGSCLCGAVSCVVAGELGAPDACHCVHCRKHSGHYFASANVAREALEFTGQENVSWYQSSANVRRGFSSRCDRLERHIFVAEQGDCHEISDNLPKSQH